MNKYELLIVADFTQSVLRENSHGRASAFTFFDHLWRIFCGETAKNRAFRGFRAVDYKP
jgi:hypothetical protein